ncbi:AAA family ATPase [Streptosporangium sp. LJ11]|uniref:ATP-binding protein n=1 Tax=Streptosporangium sp. LJ11 TaxID=3436927 RepID=UPI003F794B10
MNPRLEIVYHDEAQLTRFSGLRGDTVLGAALADADLLLTTPLPPHLAGLPISALNYDPLRAAQLVPGSVVYYPGGEELVVGDAPDRDLAADGRPERPELVSEAEATQLAYHASIHEAASFLRAGLSVLISCDKIVVPHLAEHIVHLSTQEPHVLSVPTPPSDQATAEPVDMRRLNAAGGPTSLRQRLLAQLRELLEELSEGQVLVISHLDLLGGGSDSALANETRDLVDLLYSAEKQVMLAFSDPSLTLPEVLASRFAVRMAFEGSPRNVRHPKDGSIQPIEHALLTVSEAERFAGIDTADFYKYVAGLNPVRLRQAIRYSYQETEGRENVTVKDLQQNIRKFKAQASNSFEIPDVTFSQIGGYHDVKAEIQRALDVMSAASTLPEDDQGLRGELIPRGFIFHGEPGTGKTLFAKAIANAMDATIQVVSGPEVTDKYVGESERKIRELFAEARRNAPAVIVFDEFDAIAASRSTSDDGGSRAGNAMVAQILTEMDGFRPDVQMLVVGTTNRLEIIDRALLRPSRFQSFHIGLPDPEARRGIIEVHAKRFKVDVHGLIDPLVVATEGWNGDEIRALFRDAYVGRWQEEKEADAERLGELVGHYQRARREQQRSKAGRQ